MKKINSLIKVLIVSLISFKNVSAQISTGENPVSFLYSSTINYSRINSLTYSDYVDYEKIDSIIVNDPDSALLCGQPIDVNLDFMNLSNVIYENELFKILTLKLSVEHAKSTGVYFSSFSIPEGFKLFAYNSEFTDIVGSIEGNVQTSPGFAIRPIMGNNIILELYCPKNSLAIPSLTINKIGLFYFNSKEEVFGKNLAVGTSCMPDVHCHDNILTRGRERGVLKWIYYDTEDNKYYSCSASLLNQNTTWNYVKPLIYTANHCGKNADLTTAQFFFNYQKPQCNSGQLNINYEEYTMIGATFRAKKALSDMFLMELNQHPPASFNVRYLGWNRDPDDNNGTLVEGIHHPRGFGKRYSSGELKIGSTLFHKVEWVANSTSGPTDQGSSGSPLFSMNTGHVIGVLSHGLSDCDNLSGKDSYGKVKSQWDDSGGSSKRLKDWLDPVGSNPSSVAGSDPCFNNLVIPAVHLRPASNYQPLNRVLLQAYTSITTSGNVVIDNFSEYAFTAGNEIALTTGFSAGLGATFSAYNADCTGIAVGHRDLIESLSENQILNEKIALVKISVFPNPSNGIFTVEKADDSEANISVFDIQGKLLKSFKQKGNKIEVNLTGFEKGMYFLSLESEGKKSTKKIVIQ